MLAAGVSNALNYSAPFALLGYATRLFGVASFIVGSLWRRPTPPVP